MPSILTKIFGNYSIKEIKKITPVIDRIEELEPEIQKLTDAELKHKTDEFKKRLAEGETLDDILPEAFAVVREASIRVNGERHFRVQLIGGMVLHQGRIAEMKTGEGKTLVATLPVYLNALTGKGVHVVTVNDYLAKFQSEWMGKIYRFLGLSVGLIVHEKEAEERREAYACDITYGTNNELGFDYLRDNMAIYKEEMVQRELNFAIVDEVDSILVDEARTPLIISGAGSKSTDLYGKANVFARGLKAKKFVMSDDKETHEELTEDYIIDEKAHTATLTTTGMKKAEKFFAVENLSDPENITILHHINQAIRAHGLMKANIDYVVKDGEVLIVDEFTGRIMYGRRYSEGLHQAIEAKEGVKVERESVTLATITFQNYFRLYSKLSGMTGTALTEEEEFRTIYKLDVIEIPTNMPMIRDDMPDCVYKNEPGKFKAIINNIVELHKTGAPVLIGTISIEKSELLSSLLKKQGVPHQVLNAKFHDKEAEIIAQAGKYKAVTIATNMAGRGTDIKLGGNPEFMARQEMRKNGYDDWMISQASGFYETTDPEILEARKIFNELFSNFKKITNTERDKVIEAGGLHIIGTERHESRRIDNQLRGRAGRQGDPGTSRFFISLEDDLMRLFGSDRLLNVVNALGLEDDQPIEHRILSSAIENAQKRVEGKNFEIRKHVLQYDDVMNKHREVIYSQRKKVLDGENLKDTMLKYAEKISDNVTTLYCSESTHADLWDWDSIKNYVNGIFGLRNELDLTLEEMEDFTKEDLRDRIARIADERYEAKEQEIGPIMREIERVIMLKVVDKYWMDHIDAMDQLRHGIGLRAYAQRDPVIEYKFEGYEMFEEMIKNIQEDVVRSILNTRFNSEQNIQREKVAEPTQAVHGDAPVQKTVVNKDKVGRNELCPCGSGKKYKNCHGA